MLNRDKDPILVKLGTEIRKLRYDKQVSRARIANECDISLSYLGRLERGECSPSIKIMIRIMKSLGQNIFSISFE